MLVRRQTVLTENNITVTFANLIWVRIHVFKFPKWGHCDLVAFNDFMDNDYTGQQGGHHCSKLSMANYNKTIYDSFTKFLYIGCGLPL